LSIHRIRNEKIYLTIKSLVEEKKYSVNMLCDIAEISRSAYYKWLNRIETKSDKENKTALALIKNLYKKNTNLGYRQMGIILRRDCDMIINDKRVYRLMKIEGIQSVVRIKKCKYKKTTPEITAQNILSRNFKAKYSNQKWLTDVTEFKYAGGKKLYLSAILDLGDRRIVAYKVSKYNNNALVFDNFDEAVALNPHAHPLFHSDRGFQYTTRVFKDKLNNANMQQSMSRPGRCIDNGPMEGFWAILKTEMYHSRNFKDYESLKSKIDEYMIYYNFRRYQKKLKCMTPIEYNKRISKNYHS